MGTTARSPWPSSFLRNDRQALDRRQRLVGTRDAPFFLKKSGSLSRRGTQPTTLSTPQISKELPITKWTEAISDHLHRCIGVRMTALSYVIRDDQAVDPTCPPLKTDHPFSKLHGSVDEDLIHRASHNYGLYRDDNASVYFKLEEAPRVTTYANSIKPYQRKKDGREAFLALIRQYASTDKWEAIIKEQ